MWQKKVVVHLYMWHRLAVTQFLCHEIELILGNKAAHSWGQNRFYVTCTSRATLKLKGPTLNDTKFSLRQIK
jgi:hypothetical protein